MKNSIILVLTINLIFLINLSAQQGNSSKLGGKITGKVVDSSSKNPIEYSNIVISKTEDTSFVTGTVSDKEGQFNLERIRPGNYYVDVRFMGFKSERINNLEISRNNRVLDLGTIELELNAINMTDVEVIGERSGVEYKIDKKVVNVAKHYTATSGNAVDVLENVPSVSVDIEGNVSLRGSGNFTLLIDNRPTVLDANDALQQIPASTIEDIEIITNPSAKYDPDGQSGIINLIMKKEGYSGTSGTINLNAGLDEKYGGDFILNYKTGIITTYIGADYNKRFSPGNSENRNYTIYDDYTSYINSDGTNNRGRTFYGLRGGLDLNFTQNDQLGFAFRIGKMKMQSEETLSYESWNTQDNLHNFYNNESERERSGRFYSLSTDYRHIFGANGHALSAGFYFRGREMDETNTNKLFDANNAISLGTIITEDGPADGIRVNLDYKLPFSETNKMEIGYQNRLDNSIDKTTNSYYLKNLQKFFLIDSLTRDIDYQRYIHSIYSLYSGELGNFGYQGGLRAEYTDRKIELASTNEKYIIDRWDYFPTLHFSFKLDEANQFITSYTKRIVRPRGWNLEPFETWIDAYNVRKGNPDLQPEDIDSYEAGYQHYFGNNLFSIEAYYRITNDKIEDILNIYPDENYDNVRLRTVENVGKDYSFGTELMFDYNVTEWLKLNLMGDLFDYKVEGILNDKDFSRSSTNWRTRLNSQFKIYKGTSIQFNTSYNSESVSSQGTREGFFTSNLALKHEIMENLTGTLQLRDIFATQKHEFTSSGENFYNYSYFDRKAPMIMLNLNYNINNYKPNKKDRENGGNDSSGEDEDF